ncbi:MAG TPA: hypothetical protein VG940_05625 [Gemmatimonadales bacterium]|nr:hypothetical protein [Gemmatimonadales bacterium]
MPSSLGALVRPVVSYVAILQVALGALTLEHTARGDAERGPAVRIEHQHQHEGLPLHDPDLCPICQLHTATLFHPEETRVAQLVERAAPPASALVALPAARGPPSAHRTRAPPALA